MKRFIEALKLMPLKPIIWGALYQIFRIPKLLLWKTLALPSQVLGSDIPKVIHQTYWSSNLPPLIEENIRQLRALNPDWEYRFYDDAGCERFIEKHYGKTILGVWRRIGSGYGACRADLFRYLVMDKLGGVFSQE